MLSLHDKHTSKVLQLRMCLYFCVSVSTACHFLHVCLSVCEGRGGLVLVHVGIAFCNVCMRVCVCVVGHPPAHNPFVLSTQRANEGIGLKHTDRAIQKAKEWGEKEEIYFIHFYGYLGVIVWTEWLSDSSTRVAWLLMTTKLVSLPSSLVFLPLVLPPF